MKKYIILSIVVGLALFISSVLWYRQNSTLSFTTNNPSLPVAIMVDTQPPYDGCALLVSRQPIVERVCWSSVVVLGETI